MSDQAEENINIRILRLYSVLVTFVCIVGLSFFVFMRPPGPPLRPEDRDMSVRSFKNNYHFISPLLECSDSGTVSQKQVVTMEANVRAYIVAEESQNTIDTAAVYFRDLNNGPWFGIDQDIEFVPGSLLKMPLMIALLKNAENHPGFMDKKVEFFGPRIVMPQYFPPKIEIVPGHTYTVEELITSMIKYSDNDATVLVSGAIDDATIQNIYQDLGIPAPVDSVYKMPVRNYASFFRVLYNATYLERNMSERALELLSESDFPSGIRAGVPSGLKVSSKFGERSESNGTVKQLHDCGIIYYPKRPYLLCVMSRGSNFNDLTKVIAHISKIVYDTVNKK